jgi:hypothetical protein
MTIKEAIERDHKEVDLIKEMEESCQFKWRALGLTTQEFLKEHNHIEMIMNIWQKEFLIKEVLDAREHLAVWKRIETEMLKREEETKRMRELTHEEALAEKVSILEERVKDLERKMGPAIWVEEHGVEGYWAIETKLKRKEND